MRYRALVVGAAASLVVLGGCKPNVEELQAQTNAALLAGDGPTALKALDRLIELDPSVPDYHADRGQALELIGDFDGAIESYKKACSLAPARSDLALLRGAAFLRGGDANTALGDLRVVSEAEPDNLYARGLFAVALARTSKSEHHAKAERVALPLLEKDPNNVGALVALGWVRHRQGQVTEAQSLADRARQQDDRDPLVAELVAKTGLPRGP